MIQGRVVGLQARADITFRLSPQPDVVIEFAIDTGFEGALTLPPAAVTALGLPYLIDIDANLADDTRTKVAVHQATIVWSGAELPDAVLALGRRPLLGTALLDGQRQGGAAMAEHGPECPVPEGPPTPAEREELEEFERLALNAWLAWRRRRAFAGIAALSDSRGPALQGTAWQSRR